MVQVYIQGKGALKVGDLEIGDRVLAASADGKPVSSEVIFMHEHKDVSTTVQIYVAEDMMELTPAHMVAVQTESCGRGYCSDAELVPAKEIRAGDKIYVTDGATTAVQVRQQQNTATAPLQYRSTARATTADREITARSIRAGRVTDAASRALLCVAGCELRPVPSMKGPVVRHTRGPASWTFSQRAVVAN